MAGAKVLFSLLFDPRGRMNRSGLLVSATILLVVELLIVMTSGGSQEALPTYLMVAKAIGLWVGTAGIIKRLHDADFSAWFALIGMGALCAWSAVVAILAVFALGIDALNPAAPSHVMVLGLIMLPAVGMALWLHLTPGTPATNRFGHAPAGLAGLKPASGYEATA